MILNDRYQKDYSVYKATGYPVKHRRKVPFRPEVRLERRYRSIIDRINALDAELERIVLSDTDYIELVNDSFSTNIHRSLSMEGNPLSEMEIRRVSTSFLSGKDMDGTLDAPRQEVLNHLYSFFSKESFSLPWSLETVSGIHGILTSGTGIASDPGVFRQTYSNVMGTDGFEYFITCPPGSIVDELSSLIEWLNTSPFDAVITATLFFHEFESIHPFDDGNGRAGRTMFHILLQENGLKNSRLCKLEKEILGSLPIYYDLLAYTDQTGDYEPFIMYVAESILHAYEEALGSLREKDVLKRLDEASKALVIKAKGRSWFPIADAVAWLGSVGEQSIRKRLANLERLGVIESEGMTRSKRYRFKDPFSDLKVVAKKRFRQQRLHGFASESEDEP